MSTLPHENEVSAAKLVYWGCHLNYWHLKIEYGAGHIDYWRWKMNYGTLKLKNDRFRKIGEGSYPIDGDCQSIGWGQYMHQRTIILIWRPTSLRCKASKLKWETCIVQHRPIKMNSSLINLNSGPLQIEWWSHKLIVDSRLGSRHLRQSKAENKYVFGNPPTFQPDPANVRTRTAITGGVPNKKAS